MGKHTVLKTAQNHLWLMNKYGIAYMNRIIFLSVFKMGTHTNVWSDMSQDLT